MSDEKRPHQQDDEVEAHGPGHGHRPAANAEAGDEAERSDEVEAHGVGHGHRPAANAEAGDEADGDDDFEAHRSHKMA